MPVGARQRPIQTFAKAVAKCSTEVRPEFDGMETHFTCFIQKLTLSQASVYGKCVMVDYNAVHKDKCLTEFLRLKECYLVSCIWIIKSGYLLLIFYHRRLLRSHDATQQKWKQTILKNFSLKALCALVDGNKNTWRLACLYLLQCHNCHQTLPPGIINECDVPKDELVCEATRGDRLPKHRIPANLSQIYVVVFTKMKGLL